MHDLDRKKQWILEYERRFAFKLGEHVIGKPKMSVWMILIPIIIVWHMFRFKKYVEARNAFGKNYLRSREQALQAAHDSLVSGTPPRLQEIVDRMQMPSAARPLYRDLLSVLTVHFRDLLAAEGEDIDRLLKHTYRRRIDYLLYLNRLGQAEKRLHAALRTELRGGRKDIDETIAHMEMISEAMRRREAERLFP